MSPSTHDSKRQRRLIGWGAALAAVALVGVVARGRLAASPEANAKGPRVIDRRSLKALAPEASGKTGTTLRDHIEDLDLPPVAGATYFLTADEKSPLNPGTLERPWGDLQTAFARLKPGDRLIILPGKYRGPFVIDDPALDGTAERPIEVVARVDAVFKGTDAQPVLEIRKAHWVLRGFEIIPGDEASFGFATRGSGAHDISFSRGHLHDGLHSGILIAPGSARITISSSHVHIFGPMNRGKAMDLPASGANPVVGVVIAPGTADITFEGTNVHNIAGPPLLVLEPNQYPVAAGAKPLPAAVRVVDRDSRLQSNWIAPEPPSGAKPD